MLRFCWHTFTSKRSAWLCTTHASANTWPDNNSSKGNSSTRMSGGSSAGKCAGDFTTPAPRLCLRGFSPMVNHRPKHRDVHVLSHIPTHLIAGPLGAGKTSLIRHLLAQRPADERWAVLVNEFGQIGLDAALLTTADDGIALSEVAGGCLCCINGAPFQIGLARLLRKAKPHRLFIEPSGLGHPAELLQQLRDPPWEGVLALQPSVLVLDAQALAAGEPLPATQQAALGGAGLLVLNKAENLDEGARAKLAGTLPERPMFWTTQGALPLSELPGLAAQAGAADGSLSLPNSATNTLNSVWLDPREPICQSAGQADGWSIGWRWHPSQQLELMRVQSWLATLPWRRAKLVLHTNAGWLSGNALNGEPIHWQSSEWRKDSRLELIFNQSQDELALGEGVAKCLVGWVEP
jgi:G3E family GTPase